MRDVSVPIKKAWLNFIRAVSGVKLPVFTLINDADVHGVGVQVNATVEWIWLIVESHHACSGNDMMGITTMKGIVLRPNLNSTSRTTIPSS